MGYKEKVAMATMMESMGKKKKKAQLRKDIEEAKKQGFDVTIKYDPATGEYAPTFSYKQPTKTQAEKDAEITEMFQQDAQQAYGGDMAGVKTADIPQRMGQQTRGEIQAGATQKYGQPFYTSPNMNPQQQQQRLQTKADIKGIPTTAGNIQAFRKPFEAAGQIMRPDASGKMAPVKQPGLEDGQAPGGFKGSKWQYDKILGDLKARNIMKRTPEGIDIKVDNPTRRHAIEHLQIKGHLNWRQDPEAVKLVMSFPAEQNAAVTKKRVLSSQLTEEAIQSTMKKHQISREELMSRLEVIEE